MSMNLEQVSVALESAVPMVKTLSLEFLEFDDGRAVLELPDQQLYHNHIGGPHAGAMFTLGESASGAIVIGSFAERLADAVPLAMSAEIRYLRIAKGRVTATATMSRTAADVLAELDEGKRPEFDVDITIADESGQQTGQMVVRWTLKPLKKN
jgi:uncharacterized protein (TIGR00369 family)